MLACLTSHISAVASVLQICTLFALAVFKGYAAGLCHLDRLVWALLEPERSDQTGQGRVNVYIFIEREREGGCVLVDQSPFRYTPYL